MQRYAPRVEHVQESCRKASWVNARGVGSEMVEFDELDPLLEERALRVELADERGGGVSVVSFSSCPGRRCASSGASRHDPHSRRYLSFRQRSDGGFAAQLRQTTVPHLRHSATRSRAQCLSFPTSWCAGCVACRDVEANMLALRAFNTTGTLPYCAFPAVRTTSDMVSPLWLMRSMRSGLLSLLQRRECVIRLLRNNERHWCIDFETSERE